MRGKRRGGDLFQPCYYFLIIIAFTGVWRVVRDTLFLRKGLYKVYIYCCTDGNGAGSFCGSFFFLLSLFFCQSFMLGGYLHWYSTATATATTTTGLHSFPLFSAVYFIFYHHLRIAGTGVAKYKLLLSWLKVNKIGKSKTSLTSLSMTNPSRSPSTSGYVRVERHKGSWDILRTRRPDRQPGS
ncbi:hypothetical protein P167DRAFT_57597 [Morchella conica CCBAS932]|uniref:Uncharacterized protein n=1 Tax=Morchella conica CCBAS932 TaxID=1392247 RepID=A0A3N4KYU7_9PEZI|nr:hypothetical protein P167DRAFT_57597 [Morchella conica CCBAS932]